MAGPTDPPDWVKANSGKVQSAFDRAQADKQKTVKPVATNSQQVSNNAPGMNGPNPPQNAKSQMAREAHNRNMNKDDQEAKRAAARDKMKAIKSREERAPEKSKDKDHER